MKRTTKDWVALRRATTIPAAVLGEATDKTVPAKTKIQLPADYAKHLIDDKFADPCDPPKKKAAKKSTKQDGDGGEGGDGGSGGGSSPAGAQGSGGDGGGDTPDGSTPDDNETQSGGGGA